MNSTVSVLLTVTLVVAAVDWFAVVTDRRSIEYVAKPLTMVTLIAAVLAMDVTSSPARACFVAALVFSLAGDVFLMLPDRERFFVFGLGSFLVGHLAYVPGLLLLGFEPATAVLGVAVVAASMATLGRRVVRGVAAAEPKLAPPVTVYMIVISLMVSSAFASAIPAAIVGAILFYSSDALIAWNEFIDPKPWGRIAIMVTYHLGQIGLALALVT